MNKRAIKKKVNKLISQKPNALGITREIRTFFREREVKRIEKYKKEMAALKAEVISLGRSLEASRNTKALLKAHVQKAQKELNQII